MEQQQQAKQYFQSAAADWQRKSENASGAYSVIEGRNQAVLDVIDRSGAKTLLDVGCGTGQLVIEAARRGLEAEGNDFAAEMVVQCEANASAAGVSATFRGGSFFDLSFEDSAYDVVSAQGFIEYISPAETDEFFRRCFELLSPGGSVAVGSRNRLFNCFSLNEFTRLEMELGTLGVLLAEATALNLSSDTESALAALRRFERIDPQPDRHPKTGIPVATRYQFSPGDLAYRLRRCGLEPAAIYPVHFHGLPTTVIDEHTRLHSDIARLVAQIGLRECRFVPFSSSFVMQARKASSPDPRRP
jgi:2-polyprenyl-3-methyl-5-hydroxy-6-metoxy-1,4-benzoquinol methylase